MWFRDGDDDDDTNQPQLVTPDSEAHGGPAAGEYAMPADLPVPGDDTIDESQLG